MLAFLKKRSVRWVRASILVILLGGGALVYWYGRASLADFVGIDLRGVRYGRPVQFSAQVAPLSPSLSVRKDASYFLGPSANLDRDHKAADSRSNAQNFFARSATKDQRQRPAAHHAASQMR